MKTDPASTVATMPGLRSLKEWPFLAATFCGAGYIKPGPGTWGSIAAVLVWVVVGSLAPGLTAQTIFLLAAIAAAIAIGVPAATICARRIGREDPQFVVIDEVAGQWIALLGCPADLSHGLICLILFRLFDITKPFPIRRLELLPEGWGVLFDDVAAGLYALGMAALLRHWY